MQRAAIYARYSSELQSIRSIDDQVELCKTYCGREGYAPVLFFSDRALPGLTTAGRAGLDGLLDAAARGSFDLVVVEALDRISRDMADLATIYKMLRFAGSKLVAVHDGVADEVAIGVRGLVGALYLTGLAHKTRRGLAGKLKQGMRAGGLPYGYRPILGRPGEHEIHETAAVVVRQIFESYANGLNPRIIVSQLNEQGIEPNRGRVWNASTLNGSSKRASGMLSNEIYRGEIVWNKVGKIKNPATGKRVPRINPPEVWHRVDAPHLRIVDEALWRRVTDRREGRRAGPRERHLRGPQRLLSGLLKCSVCGSSMVSAGSDHGRPVAACPRYRESGDCANRRKIYLDTIEESVLAGLRDHLRDPAKITGAVREYHAERRRLAADAARDRASLERKRDDVRKQIDRLVNALADGTLPASAIGRKLGELEAEDADLLQRMAVDAQNVVTMHPAAVTRYMEKVEHLASALASGADREAIEIVRALVDHFTVYPREKCSPVSFDIVGKLAALLDPSVGTLVPRGSMVTSRVALLSHWYSSGCLSRLLPLWSSMCHHPPEGPIGGRHSSVRGTRWAEGPSKSLVARFQRERHHARSPNTNNGFTPRT